MIKTTGAELKKFINSDWEKPTHYYDDVNAEVNGEPQDSSIDFLSLGDTDTVKILEANIYDDETSEYVCSLQKYFTRWRKKQTSTIIMVECKYEYLDYLKEAIKAAHGRVIK
jgi:hypothetical protein